ncbi:type VII secretion integral membrane protein EccD [Micromonospora sp. NBC_01813]|uniref:type VII secretion integral membrane protein EccD n=1 Tax=Micromonospora sp. NBC_01813 TaxID=2975988 RepID=UPI002DDB52C2|nr:type VII secretion integral membrane protein EccD [Micromonospora sp. NBC_01813]WSA06762.1 type VII secretion integral membrane protein EccD [Micromonospora sp. NBC_01813]
MVDALTRITVCGPRRRTDLALPGHVPVAELLPELLRHGGDGLADAGERHGGWVLRRADGAAVSAAEPLVGQGVRDGDVLHLVPGQADWPEPEYDDVVEVIAVAARGQGPAWSAAATRRYAYTTAAGLLGLGWLALLTDGDTELATMAGAVAVAVAAGAVLACRVWRDDSAGAVLGGCALAYAFAAGLLGAADGAAVGPRPADWPTAIALLVGLGVLAVAGIMMAVVLTAGRPVPVAAVTVGVFGGLAATAAHTVTGAAGAAAGLLVVLGCGVGLLPRLATRLGQVPVTGAVSGSSFDRAAGRPPDQDRVRRGVARAEQLLTGMLIGYAVLAAAAGVVLVQIGGVAGHTLVGVAAVALLLRSRTFVTIRQRLPLLVAGLALALLLVAGGLPAYLSMQVATLVPVAGVLALVTVAVGGRYAAGEPSPYLSRAADILDTAAVVSLIPVAGAVLGLYRWATGLLT